MEHIKSHSSFGPHKAKGFSLIEILVVLTIISLLLSMSALGINSIADATNLTSGGDQIVSYLVQARQKALSENAHVEVRFYPPPESEPVKQWTVVLARQGLEELPMALQRPLILSESIAIIENNIYSTLITERESQLDSTLVGSQTKAAQEFVSFRFHPDGSTNLPSNPNGDTWHLTAISRKNIEAAEKTLPNNFYTIRVDPFTGAIRSFRP